MSFICKKFSQKLPPEFIELKKEIKKAIKKRKNEMPFHLLSNPEKEIIERIREQTGKLNANNVTRTSAYFDMYLRYPNLHWAFLGHMVSRNGGWNMTDLKGELISRLLSEKEQNDFFSFLERGNWLIFQDVYPQFLIYEESVNSGSSLFHLLSYFGVSVFMEGVWNRYLEKRDDKLLAIALVINEQTYLEKRVIQNFNFLKHIIFSFEFQLQDLLGLNQVLFPYLKNEKEVGLIGETIHHFAFLSERISLGKRLYSLLFENEEMLKKVVHWAEKHPHTGSRKDFFPHVFNDVKELPPGKKYVKKLNNCTLQKNAAKLYSPQLKDSWQNAAHAPAEKGDWFADFKILKELADFEEKGNGEIENDYCETLEKLEIAIITKEAVFRKEA
ncbi:DUF2515 domain-containing protein [Pueribacillus theae]|uniref:DUF2515 domain-containing protein n=1 Tax=Pueribacillus theae TaxID=2171751 RepID=A0A2U1K6I1_9BACI|nr:DUF2515 family protein [Pueribacillus theae]PWA13002.1 DUF2515 domain-containing protein [Pueribacillus theae]